MYIRYILTSEHCGHKWTLFSNMRFIAKFITAVCVNVLLPIPIPTHEYFLVCKAHSTSLRFFWINSIAGGSIHYLLYYLSPLLMIEMFSIRLSDAKANRRLIFLCKTYKTASKSGESSETILSFQRSRLTEEGRKEEKEWKKKEGMKERIDE